MATPHRNRVKPTAYPSLPFHSIRTLQLLSATIVSSILFYFLRELAREGYHLPWTFILLMTVSILTMLSLLATILLHCYHGLNPLLNVLLNAALALLWSLAFSLLTWWAGGTLAHVCDTRNWESEMGVGVCRMYKALFSFALLGLVATLAALALDVRVMRGARERGVFQPVDSSRGGMEKGGGGGEGERELDLNPMVARTGLQGGEGYAVPEEQFGYDDLAYHGAGGQVGRRSMENRI
ncbi:marvel domain-containing 2 [Pyrenophora seminiperda CCB06]|uniref:Marvel domain-containing 2 n=1 Tax=Pyrenophora seminiperda CCB06 TaxID=1302712 RepID=A0A3M7M1X0_9PLEO|nr:marvel domain-containing 2 [Pyrenophora seminiperda CCB06]